MNIIDLETPKNTKKHLAPHTDCEQPFYITAYGKTFRGTLCYQLRMDSPVGCVQYVISGSGIIICNDRIYTVSSGDTFLLPEGSNQIYYSNPDNRFERIWLNFKGELADKMLQVYKIKDTIVFKNTDASQIIAKIYEKCKTLENPKEYQNVTARMFLQLIQFLADNRNEKAETASNVEKIRLYIDCHITENLKISDIAKEFSISSEHTIRIFKKIYGITPHQYILQSKIRLAMIMLKMTDSSIEEIAEKLNFSDSHHFSAQFKKYSGFNPAKYRKN